MPNLNELSVAELRKLAKEQGLKGLSNARKDALIEALSREESQSIKEEKTRRNEKAAPAEEITERAKKVVPAKEIPERTEEVHSGKEMAEKAEPAHRNSRQGQRPHTGTYSRSYDSQNSNNRSYDSQNSNNRSYDSQNSNNRSYDNQNGNNRSYDNQNGRNYGQQRRNQNNYQNQQRRQNAAPMTQERIESLNDTGMTVKGILDITDNNGNVFGFIRGENYLTCENDIYVANSQIRRFGLKVGDYLEGPTRAAQNNDKCDALLYISKINGEDPEKARNRASFEKLTPVFPDERLNLIVEEPSNAMRIMNLFSPIGKGQRGMIVSPPKAGKTSLLKEVAHAIKTNHPEVHIIILLIDERPEEVTDIKEYIQGDNVEVIYSTFDELPEHHTHVAEMVLERGKRLVEQGQDCMILLDSLTRLTRAYNLTVTPCGRTLSGGLDPTSLHMPKKFFGAARNIRGGGSLTILATALVDTGSRMDDVVFEEFKGTGNMEIVLDRKMSERRVFPAIDLFASGTRRDDLLLTEQERLAMTHIRRQLVTLKPEEVTEQILQIMEQTESNEALIEKLSLMQANTRHVARTGTSTIRNNRTVIKDNRSQK